MIKIIGMFMAFTAIVGFVEFGVSFMIISNNLSRLASEGEIVRVTEVLAVWLNDIVRHLVIDVIVGAISTFVFEVLEKC